MQHNEVHTEVRQFQGLWLPVEILQMRLSPTAKLLWADIHSFTGRNASFFKSNQKISEDYNISQRTASRAIKELESASLISTKTDGRKRWCRSRVDNLSMQTGHVDKAELPNCLHSKQESKQHSKQLSKARPTLELVAVYFVELGMSPQDGEKFFDYYETNGWKQGRGKAIKDWKAAARNWQRNADKWNTTNRGFNTSNFSHNGAIDFVNNG
ncbi:MAG: hypothetical protein Unbinned1446contig1005_32 [Prokaryotic dsDNA virus sp.]|nr:MAG: hypothetical protein Unbinned1446contig1005_32 [Prokaryotic dsDNA virus sp.]|tara:strand:+ start:7198 stop:7833 length:636 start_codon:yes stop_codon:yes gene_type:complete